MQEDLTLFLNEKALTFSQWLHSVLTKLQKVTFGGSIEAKKAKATKKSKLIEGGKKKNKAKLNEAPEKIEERTEEVVQGPKFSSKNTISCDQSSHNQAKNNIKSAPFVKDGCKTIKDDTNQ